MGDCLERLKELEDNSVDSVVTDPPYGLKFMGKKWDYDVPTEEMWRSVLRVVKPGGHLLSFGGTRTYHRLALAIEEAGFEIRDQLQWLYGSGFPKSLDISKAIDKKFGAKGEAYVDQEFLRRNPDTGQSEKGIINKGHFDGESAAIRHKPSTPEAYRYKGWGTALKPANEPIILARKPLEKGLTVAENMLKWGVGGLNIDESRIEATDQKELEKNWDRTAPAGFGNGMFDGQKQTKGFKENTPQGRWPANLLLDETAAQMLDEQSGTRKSGGSIKSPETSTRFKNTHSQAGEQPEWDGYQDSGGASRFFYVAKASKRERNAGLDGMPDRIVGALDGNVDHEHGNRKIGARPDVLTAKAQNHHPTVKPIKLMEYLCKLITPDGGVILDPFCGSGSTLVAAKRLGFEAIGIEMNEEYCEIARNRIESVKC